MTRILGITLASLLISGIAFASCGDDYGCGNGSCGSETEYDNICQCTDPSCWSSYDRTCMSKSTCCQAFGNIGAR